MLHGQNYKRRELIQKMLNRDEPIFFNQPICNLLLATCTLQIEIRPYVLYNDNKYLCRSLISGCLFNNDSPTNIL
jgi:hypothetical protein